MLTFLGSFAAIALLVLGVCYLDGDFHEGGLFAEMAKRVARVKLPKPAQTASRVAQNPS